jgi:hypothetical protein
VNKKEVQINNGEESACLAINLPFCQGEATYNWYLIEKSAKNDENTFC